jgi:hypothetical protein
LSKNLRRNNTAGFNEMSESVLISNHRNFQYFQNLKLNTLRQTVDNVRIVTIRVAVVDITVHATAVVVVAAVDTVAAVAVAAAVDTVAVAAVVVAAAVDTVAVAAVAVVAVEAAAVDTVAVAAVVEAAAVDTVVENLAVAATERAILTVVNHVVKITSQVKVQAKATKVARNPPAVTATKAVATVAGKRTESLFF